MLTSTNPSVSPNINHDWLKEIYDAGYINLYNFLIKMREYSSRGTKNAASQHMAFDDRCNIILETKSIIIDIVRKNIPVSDFLKVLFILGCSGAGKSTFYCAIKGDKIEVKDLTYTSKNNPELIEHNVISGSFLPHITCVDNFFIVDFGGLDDTNGYLIEWGIEFALKTLLNEYTPKIIVLEPINDIGNRFEAAAKRGRFLDRLFGRTTLNSKKESNPKQEVCLLGITKYSRLAYYQQLLDFDTKIFPKRDQLNQTKKTYAEFIHLEEMSNAFDIKMKQTEILLNLEKEAIEEELLAFQQSKKNVKMMEENLLNQIGLKKFIRIRDIEKPANVVEYLKILKNCPNSKNINPILELDFLQEKTLTEWFHTEITVNNYKNYHLNASFDTSENFEAYVIQNSFIMATQLPNITRLFNQEIFNSDIMLDLDRKLIKECTDRYCNSLRTLNIPEIKLFLKKEVSTQKIRQLINALTDLENIISELPSAHLSIPNEREEKFLLPNWMKCLNYLPKWQKGLNYFSSDASEELAVTLKKLVKFDETTQSYSLNQLDNKVLTTCITEANQLHQITHEFNRFNKILKRKETLKELEKAAKKQKENECFTQQEGENIILLSDSSATLFSESRNTKKNTTPPPSQTLLIPLNK